MIQIENNEHMTVMPDGVIVVSPDRNAVPVWVRSQFDKQRWQCLHANQSKEGKA